MLKDTGQEGLLEARYRLAKIQGRDRGARVQVGGHGLSRGLVDPPRAGRSRRRAAERWLTQSGSTSRRSRPPMCRPTPRNAPRLGVWVPWADTDSIGWLRYTLDQRSIPYTYVRDEDIRGGNAARQVRRAALRPRRPRAGRADPRHAEAPGGRCRSRRRRRRRAHGTPADRTTSPAASAGRAGADPGVRRERRRAGHARQRLHAAARGRHRARRAPRFRRRAAQFGGRRRRGGAASRSPSRARPVRTCA